MYFVRWVIIEKKTPEIFYSLSFGTSTFFIAIFSPILGAIADRQKKHKFFLVGLTSLSVIFTILLGVSNNIFVALLFFAIANFGCQTAVVFYNTLLSSITSREKIGFISGIGRMFGYSGAILALYLTRPFLERGYQAIFISTGFFFLIFSLPCMLFVKAKYLAKPDIDISSRKKLFEIVNVLKKIIFNIRNSTNISNFLKASFFSLICINTIILFISVYATKVFGLDEVMVRNLIVFSTFFAIGGSFFSGFVSDYLGHKYVLLISFFLWMIGLFLAAISHNSYFFWIISGLMGLSLGSIWTVARALGVRLSPKEDIGKVFGLFNLVGYLSAIVGAIFWGLILVILLPLGEIRYRIAILSLVFFMVFGFIFLLRISKEEV